MTIREARWDCQQCGTTGMLGRDKVCLNCGHPRPEGVRFYLPEDAEAVERSLAAQARQGADFICMYCGATNQASLKSCRQCGASHEGATSQEVKEYKSGEVPRSGDNTYTPPPLAEAQAKTSSTSRPQPQSNMGWIALAIVVFLCLCSAFVLFRSSEVGATVRGFAWERAIAVEELQTLEEEDWELPADARLLSQQEEIHHTEEVLDHYETRTREVSEQVEVGTRTYVCGQRDLGNGFFEDIECEEPVYETQTQTETYEEPIYRSEPVYQTKYRYEIDRWVEVRTEEAAGDDQNPFWPEVALAEFEAEGERREEYLVIFQDEDGESYRVEVSEERWRSFSVGDRHQLEVDSFGNAELVGEN